MNTTSEFPDTYTTDQDAEKIYDDMMPGGGIGPGTLKAKARQAGAFAAKHVHEQLPKEVLEKLLADSITAAEALTPEPLNESSRENFEFIWAKDFHTLPVPDFVVDNTIPDRAVTIFYGLKGSFKTFCVVDILAAVAADAEQRSAPVRVFNKFPVLKPGDTALSEGEQYNGLGRLRIPAWCKHRKVDISGLRFAMTDEVPKVSDASQIDAFVADLRAAGAKPRIVGFDTVARALTGLNENDNSAMGLMVDAAERACKLLDCAVILIAHTGKDVAKGVRGGYALSCGAGTIWKVTRPNPASLAVRLDCENMKDIEPPDPIYLAGTLVSIDPNLPKSPVFNVVGLDEFKAMTGDKSEGSITVSVLNSLKARGIVEPLTCSTKEMVFDNCTLEGLLDDDLAPKERDRVLENRRKAITKARLKDGTLQALAITTPGGLRWAAPAEGPSDDD